MLNFQTLAAAWLFALAIPLTALYFLKLKRPRQEVPSLVLWRQVIADQRVNSPFQRFRKNLLLWLQLAVLGLVAFAAMQPFVESATDRTEFLPVLIDGSASMAALDRPGGTTRLEAAKANVRQLIDNLPPYQQIALIGFHGGARRLTDFTDNRRVLHAALDKYETADVSGRLEDALRVLQAVAKSHPVKTAILLTDGNISGQVGLELPFELKVQTVPVGGANLGVTALNARRTGADRWDVFVRVEASGVGADDKPLSATIQLRRDGEETPLGAETITVERGGSSRLTFPVDVDGAMSLEVRLNPDGFDSLAADNIAYLSLPQLRPLRTHVSRDLATYRHALRDRADVDVDAPSDAAGWDLLITDVDEAADQRPSEPDAAPADANSDPGAAKKQESPATDETPKDAPAGDVAKVEKEPGRTSGRDTATVALRVGVVPDDLHDVLSTSKESAVVVDWDRTAPLLQHVLLTEVQISESVKYQEGRGEADLEALGYRALVHGATGPLMLEKRAGGRVTFYTLFHTDYSTFPYRVGFPILIANLVDIALQSASLSEARGLPTGVFPPMPAEPGTSFVVRGPDGASQSVRSGSDGALAGVAAPRVGRYEVSGGTLAVPLAASLLDAGESQLEAVDRLQFRETSVSTTATTFPRDKPLWSWLAGVGLAVLLAEWWLFQRRPGGYPTTV